MEHIPIILPHGAMADQGERLDQMAAAEVQMEADPGTKAMKAVDDVQFAHAEGSAIVSVYVCTRQMS